MSNPGEADVTPITSPDSGLRQLAEWLEAGAKPPRQFRIGTEHESFGFRRHGYAPIPYEPDGIRKVLEFLAVEEGLQPILDQGNIIGLVGDKFSLSLEPGGQFELSGGALDDLHETKAEIDTHIHRAHRVGAAFRIGFAPLGFHPTARRDDMPWMPKSRYAIMRSYMPKVGTRGLDMMLRTCTVQANLDFSSEQDMARKMRLAYRLQPMATALFANSPFREGKPTGLLSNRAHAWLDTDDARTGILRCVFAESFGFERYVQYLLDVPMYFVYRDGKYIDVAGGSFRDFMAGKLDGFLGQRPTIGDFADHATTVFPDVRLKRFIETRGADAGSPAMLVAQPALWAGLFYDEAALEAATQLTQHITYEDVLLMRLAVPERGLETEVSGRLLRDLARDVITIADDGLRARARLNVSGKDERIYLEPLRAIAEGAPTQAEHWLGRYAGAWHGDASKIFNEAAF